MPIWLAADLARATAAALSELKGVNWLALGHGQPIRQPQQAMQKAVLRANLQVPPSAAQLALARPVSQLMGGVKGHI